jgi:hypothetical protein
MKLQQTRAIDANPVLLRGRQFRDWDDSYNKASSCVETRLVKAATATNAKNR